VDYDDDGMLDLVVGDRNGFIHYYRRTSEAPITLEKQADLVCGGVTIDVGYNAAPVLVDWNEDGECDLLAGTQGGEVRLYINDTIDTEPVYNIYTLIESGGTVINRYRNCPQVFDMNMDGLKDLICGANDYSIYYYENVGTNDAPLFAGSEAIINTGSSGARFWINDWNEDGLPDVLAGNYNGYIKVYIQQTVGIGEQETTPVLRTLQVSSNPFTSSVVITGAGFSSGTIRIYDIMGRTLQSEPFSGSYVWTDNEACSGTYFAEVIDSQGSATVKLLKL
jgi:WD40 repeat protein